MKQSIKNILLAVSASLVCASCNTLVGMGQDTKRVGEGMTNVARGKTWTGNQRQPRQTHSNSYSNTYYHTPDATAPNR